MMRESIQYALDHREEALAYAMQFARDMEAPLAEKFVGMYVNHFTVDCGELVPKAAQKLLDHGLRGRADPAPRFRRVCTVKPTILLSYLRASSSVAFSQIQGDTKQRARAAHDLGKQGEQGIPKLAPYVTDTDVSVRVEAVKSLDDIGGPKTVDLLVQAAARSRSRDPDPRHRRAGERLSSRASSRPESAAPCSARATPSKPSSRDTNDQIIDAYVEVRPEVIEALGQSGRLGSQPGEPRQRLPRTGYPARQRRDSAVGRSAALQRQPDHV